MSAGKELVNLLLLRETKGTKPNNDAARRGILVVYLGERGLFKEAIFGLRD